MCTMQLRGPRYDQAELATPGPQRTGSRGALISQSARGREALSFTNPVPDSTKALAIEHRKSSSMHRWACTCWRLQKLSALMALTWTPEPTIWGA